MSDEPEDDTLLLDTPIDDDEPNATDDVNDVVEPPADDEITIDIDGEDDEPAETPVIRTLRQRDREQARRIRELEAQVAPKPIEVGAKPTLEACEWDEQRFEADLDAWKERKRAAETREAETQRQRDAEEANWQKVNDAYRENARALGVPKFEEKERIATEALPDVLTKAIKLYMKEPAKVMAALGSNAGLLDRVTAEADPIKALLMLHDAQGKINVNRKKPPAPEAETIQRGSASLSATSADKRLEALEKAAERTGDRSAVIRYKAEQRKKA